MINLGLSEIFDIIEEIANISSTNSKLYILKKYKDDSLFKKVVWYAYNDYNYGIKKTTLNKMRFENYGSKWENDLYSMLDELAKSNINNELVKEVEKFIAYFPDEKCRELIKRILLKDLRWGLNIKGINKVFKNLIITHDIMLGSKFEGKIDGEVGVTLKLDGVRSSWMVENGTVVCKTRQNKTIEGLDILSEEILRMANGKDLFIDGELLAFEEGEVDSKELFKKTSKILNSKGKKNNIRLIVFDVLPLEDYKNKKSKIKWADRRERLEELVKTVDSKYIEEAPLYFITDDINKINEKLKEVVDAGLEGLMLSKVNKPYEFKRSKNLLKVKKMHTVDLRVLGYEEGDGKNKEKLGALVVDYKGNKVKVGSGYSDEDRIKIWENKENYIGKIVEVQYFEETTNEKGGISLRFPVYLRTRDDKNDVSYE